LNELESAWTALTSESRTEPGWHSRRVAPTAPCSVRAAVRPSGLRGLLIDVPAAAIPAGADYPGCAGFSVTPETVAPGPGGSVRLTLEERGSGYRDIFTAMATDVVRRASATSTEATFVAMLLSRLAVWQRFASKFGPGILSEEARAGLAGELMFLDRVVLARLPPAEAMAAWTGPGGIPQDFRFPACYVEIKASVSASPSTMRISNLEQLDGAADLPLFLCHLSLSLAGRDALSLPDLVEAVKTRLEAAGDGSAEMLEDRLAGAGYLAVHAPHYRARTYDLGRLTCHHVTGAFPRLTSSTAPQGITGATYALSIAACQDWIVDVSECTRLIGDLVDV
jgi:hypothetical protein